MNQCQQVRQRLLELIDPEDLSDQELGNLREHLAACSECTSQLSRLRLFQEFSRASMLAKDADESQDNQEQIAASRERVRAHVHAHLGSIVLAGRLQAACRLLRQLGERRFSVLRSVVEQISGQFRFTGDEPVETVWNLCVSEHRFGTLSGLPAGSPDDLTTNESANEDGEKGADNPSTIDLVIFALSVDRLADTGDRESNYPSTRLSEEIQSAFFQALDARLPASQDSST